MRSFLGRACTLLGIRQGAASSVPSASRARRTKGKPNAQLQVNANSLRSCPCYVCVYPCPLGAIEKRGLATLPVSAIAPVILVVLTVVPEVAALAEGRKVGLVVVILIVVDVCNR